MIAWPTELSERKFYLVGIKGTGMTALAELLTSHGAVVSGSDVEDIFYTDQILASLQIPVFQGFSAGNVPSDCDIVVYSAAYDRETHPELIAAQGFGLTMLEYTQALGEFSRTLDSSGVAGVHGKTTTTAMAGTIMKGLGLKGSVLVGSGVSNFGGRSTLVQGNQFFIAETCEYRRHFLNFHPRRIVLTSVEMDHQDYFKDLEDITLAFVEYCLRLPSGGQLIYCADEAGAREVARRVAWQRPDIRLTQYGFQAEGDWRILSCRNESERQVFQVQGFQDKSGVATECTLPIPGRHNILNATAALALLESIYTDRHGELSPQIIRGMLAGLAQFHGSKRRSEILGTAGNILFMDDYAHHPTAIRTTLAGFRSFFPSRRLVVDFMSHTYSRTAALLDDFSTSFSAADEVILHEIYPSAREHYDGTITGRDLFTRTAALHPQVKFFPQPNDALEYLQGSLQSGDLFVTMGAGNNWMLGRDLYARFQGTAA